MIYLALLRGINVGGKNKLQMPRLKTVFTQNGLRNVKTYINSGNIIFEDDANSNSELVKILEKAIEAEFGFGVKVLVRDYENIKTIASALPADWVNDTAMKCDIMFLWEEFDTKDVINHFLIKPGIDDVKYSGGAVIWRVDRNNATRSGLMKIVGTPIYKHMTIRNCSTLRKLKLLMEQLNDV